MHPKERSCGVVNWIHLVRDIAQQQALVITIIKPIIPKKAGNVLAK
jgi:hypothetical protein